MIFSKLKVSYKLPLMIVLLVAISVIAVGLMSIKTSSEAAFSAAELKLSSLNYSKIERLENYLHSIDEDLDILAKSQYVMEAIQYFDAGWRKIQNNPDVLNPTEFLQKLYIEENQYPTGEKEKLDYQNDGSLYSQVHKNYHPWFRHVLKTREYYDIFLFNADGDLVYSVFKEADFATNAHIGAWKDTDLSKAFRSASNEPNSQNLKFFDFKPYAASNDAPAGFIAESVLNEDGTLAGVIAFQMPINRINQIMKVSDDIGDTAEVYIVGEDYLMRNDSDKTPQQDILKTKVETASLTKGLKGEKGVLTALDYHGQKAMQSYAPFHFNGVSWVVVAEQSYDEIMKPIHEMVIILILEIIIALLIIAVIGIGFARRISKPISSISDVMRKIAEGDFDLKVPGTHRGDEIGGMAACVEVFKKNGLEAIQLREEQKIKQEQARVEKKEAIEKMAQTFEDDIGKIIIDVSAFSAEMEETAKSLSRNASDTNDKSSVVAAAAEETSSNVNSVASAAEELTASISEISS